MSNDIVMVSSHACTIVVVSLDQSCSPSPNEFMYLLMS